MSFILVIISINIIGIKLINNSVKTNIESKIEKGAIEMNNIVNNLNYGIDDYANAVDTYLLNGTYTKIYYGNIILFTNYQETDTKIEDALLDGLNNEIRTYIKDKQLYMALKSYNYTVLTCTEISDIYTDKDNEIKYFVRISLIISLMIALALSFLVHLVTRKIKKLSKVVEKIEEGNYEVEVPNLGNDEIGEFAKYFQSMAISIDTKIKEIERISESRRIFIGNLTHEIRTPLTSIIGYSSLIKNKKVQNLEVINNYCTKIYDEGKYIESIRDKLMTMMTLDKAGLDLVEVDASDLLQKTIKYVSAIYPDASFKTKIAPHINLTLDPTLFKSMVMNFIKNGIKASSKPEITVYMDKVSIRITDNGRGIPASEIEKIKEPFYTINKDRNRKTSGMGLGLPLALEIIRVHNWTIDIESEISVGTKITIHTRGEK